MVRRVNVRGSMSIGDLWRTQVPNGTFPKKLSLLHSSTQISGGSKGGARQGRAPLSAKISLFSCSFWGK